MMRKPHLERNMRASRWMFWARVGFAWGLACLLAGCPSTDSPADSTGSDAGLGGDSGDGCVDCQLGARTCHGQKSVARCEMIDGCKQLVEAAHCPSSKVCEAGTCLDGDRTCSNVCTPDAPQRCSGAGSVERCADHDHDGCYEWARDHRCSDGDYCDAATGRCQPNDCIDRCSVGDIRCEGDLVRTCSMNDRGCMVFGAGSECPAGGVCRDRKCTQTDGCDDECTAGQAVCAAGGGRRTCRDHDGDGCVELSQPRACIDGEECRGGQCVDATSCRDECVGGETICVGSRITECADHDGDGCVEFSSPHACSDAAKTCSTSDGSARCVAAPSSGQVVINEVFYDAVGADLRTSGSASSSPTFIELEGAPGLNVSGYVVELVNGANGQTYNTFSLPNGATLDGNGFAVLAMAIADDYLSYAVPSYANIYYPLSGYGSGTDALQNGPDSIVLSDRTSSTVDAIGYGDFSGAMQNFSGEGSPASTTRSGRSLGRRPGGADTDDNSADFRSYYPTPGLDNSDLIINEVYANQPGVDDATRTFIELVAPIQGWEDMPLDGYTVHAINGYDGADYIGGASGASGVSLAGHDLNDASSDDGFVVMCNASAQASLRDVCAVTYDGADLQNGPDNVVLRFQQTRTVDAVGYGTFGPAETFVGETAAIDYTRSEAGKSLGRWPISDASVQTDTDDNYLDFWTLAPTPGAPNPRPQP